MDKMTAEIMDALNSYFRKELLILIFFTLLGCATIICSILWAKDSPHLSKPAKICIIVFVCIGAVVLTALRLKCFLPVLGDYQAISYTIEQDANVYIVNGMNNGWDEKNQVYAETKTGEQLVLSITHDYNFDTDVVLSGTIAYTNHSKHIIWYDLSPISDDR